MRILLAHNSLYYPSHGGGDKSNRLLMEALAAREHAVRVIARIDKFGPEPHKQFLDELRTRGARPEVTSEGVRFTLNGVDVHTLTLSQNLRAYLAAQMTIFDPDIIVTSTDDPGQLLFDVARRAERARIVYLVRATIAVPFGPDSSMPSHEKTGMLRHADGIVGVSEYVASYVRQWSGLDAIHLPISLMERVEADDLGRFDNPYIAMVNPCAVKGIAIFVALAERMPQLQFAAVPTWGTNAEDIATLRRVSNVTVLNPVDNIDDLLRQARVVLAPSVWAEARSRIVVEAMLRGVPVIASDAGGLREAKMGIPYLLPVRPISRYQSTLDEKMVPVADVPPQDIGPWERALDRLTTDKTHWEEIAAQSRAAARKYVSTLTIEPFETFLVELLRRPKRKIVIAPQLSEDKRRLLALRLRQRSTGVKPPVSIWFPTLETGSRSGDLRLFCFPYAGGGALAYRAWIGSLAGVEVAPVLLPGRETRAGEAPFDDMRKLIEALTLAIRPHVNTPYAFFGHSMGAGIAFELTRALRRAGASLPRALIVSSARAPQLRVNPQSKPEPSDEELIQELSGLEGLPREIAGNSDALKIALPVLRADTRLYRNYVYRAEAALDVGMFAYGGASDANVRPEHLDAWREQTTAAFTRREFEGGHFYFQSNPGAVREALTQDLTEGLVRNCATADGTAPCGDAG